MALSDGSKMVLKAVGQVLGGSVVVLGSWLATRAENGELVGDAASAAVAAADSRVAGAEAAAADAEFRLAEAESRTEKAHDTSAEAVNSCLDAVDDLEEELDVLTRDFDYLSGAVEALHGRARTARVIEAQPEPPPRVAGKRVKAEKVPTYQQLAD